MIARSWHGVTPASKSDEYLDYLNKTGVPDYKSTEGNLGVYVLRKIEGHQAHFLLFRLGNLSIRLQSLHALTQRKPDIILKTRSSCLSWSRSLVITKF